MDRRSLVRVGSLFLLLFTALPSSRALISSPEANPPYPKAISDLKEAIVKGLGFHSDEVKISGFDVRDALVGHAVSYEFDLEIDDMVLPVKLLEDVNRWEYVDLPIFRAAEPSGLGKKNGLAEMRKSGDVLPVLAPFQLAGPMELWIQDANDMRISLPYDVDAGVLKKVILADGAVVTVKGARSASLRHPIDLPLPLNQTSNEFASGLMSLAEQLRHSSRVKSSPLLSLRIVGPTSLASPSPSSSSSSSDSKLKLKRIAPGLVELSSMSKDQSKLSPVEVNDGATALLTPKHFTTTMWPIASINGSNPNLRGFEKLLTSVLGPKAQKEGTFKLLKADVSAQTFLKIGFGVEKNLKEGDLEGIPEWRTKPEKMRMHFEVLAKVEGEKVTPESVTQVEPVALEDTVARNVVMGNATMSKLPIIQPPPSPFTL
ncbi:PREDICTED: uncharacterized protein LOC104819322 [Tarenaya hassleriana]|uniref:uncharacterized protein LOC104819322 n=1 Tax=Tarenaya hassleriana TaxID=28532 RepID=UPI00053C0B99|nr:PREDICTED: uncharacterized protein LOC104819322 [Tarenaya hassleriana]